MPIYEYACTACDHRTDILHGINDPGPNFCPSCGLEGTMRKLFAPPTIHYKGTGWAKKDRGGSSGGSRPAGSPAASSGSSSAGDTKASGESSGSSGSSGSSSSSGSSGSSGTAASPSSAGSGD